MSSHLMQCTNTRQSETCGCRLYIPMLSADFVLRRISWQSGENRSGHEDQPQLWSKLDGTFYGRLHRLQIGSVGEIRLVRLPSLQSLNSLQLWKYVDLSGVSAQLSRRQPVPVVRSGSTDTTHPLTSTHFGFGRSLDRSAAQSRDSISARVGPHAKEINLSLSSLMRIDLFSDYSGGYFFPHVAWIAISTSSQCLSRRLL
jgi:hypothetical protein